VKLKKKDKTNDSSKPRTVARAMLRFEPVFLKKKKKFKILVIDLNGSISHTKITMNDKIKKPEITYVILKISEKSYINKKEKPNLQINQMLKD
jgi:hypothetical protein